MTPLLAYDQGLNIRSLAETDPSNLMAQVDILRLSLSQRLEQKQKNLMGQFLTPSHTAELMARMFENLDLSEISLLDAGSGIGSLLAAFVSNILEKPQQKISNLKIIAYEIDPILIGYLRQTLKQCEKKCLLAGIYFDYEIRQVDFIEDVVRIFQPNLLDTKIDQNSPINKIEFTHAILNPPYLKINSHAKMRSLIRSLGLETSNLYAAFIAAASQLLKPDGELVAIAPRSFCNGPYFRDFRKRFFEMMTLRQIHLFESRQETFKDDTVLQETVIIHANKQKKQFDPVLIKTSFSANDSLIGHHLLAYKDLVNPLDSEKFIHIIPDKFSEEISKRLALFTYTLNDLGLTVSTGRVVDFRFKEYLKLTQEKNTVPLIYPGNFSQGYIDDQKPTKKPQYLINVAATLQLLVPNEHYVLCKRFSPKEDKKRIVAAVYDANRINGDLVGFENHLNYFHQNGKGLNLNLARGLATYLNSSMIDLFFRLFNGHTQVNATDLRSLTYPSLDKLSNLGRIVGEKLLDQTEIDQIIEQELFSMTNQSLNIIAIKKRMDEALDILKQLGFPRKQINDRSALTLLALLDLKPTDSWDLSTSPLLGITPMMEFMSEHYGKTYKPNTRETVRRQTIHQFLEASLIVVNPDQSDRSTNSPKTVYQIEQNALELLRKYDTPAWEKSMSTYLSSVKTLQKIYAQEREMSRIPIIIEDEIKTLSPGGQNILIKKITEEFAPLFTPGGKLIYVGDTGKKIFYFEEEYLRNLGVSIDPHGKMPDVIIHHTSKDWLILIEAVTSHGPIDPKRKKELEIIFKGVKISVVMVTSFLSRKAMIEHLADIAWETDVWIAEEPTHLIHFNGESLLQPYQH